MGKQFLTRPTLKVNRGETGVLSIINSPKNGKRMELKNVFLENIGYKEGDAIQFEYDDVEGYLDIGVFPIFGKENSGFTLTKSGTKSLLYSAGLVMEMTRIFGLDYSQVVSKTFATYKRRRRKSGEVYARIFIREPEITEEVENHEFV